MERKIQETQEVMTEEAAVNVPLKERIGGSKPIQFVKRHAKGVVAGAAGGAAVLAAAVVAAKVASDKGGTDIGELVGDIVDDATEVVTGE